MKRNWLLAPLLMLVAAGILVVSCPSDPEPEEKNYSYRGTDSSGNEYTLTIKNNDYTLTVGDQTSTGKANLNGMVWTLEPQDGSPFQVIVDPEDPASGMNISGTIIFDGGETMPGPGELMPDESVMVFIGGKYQYVFDTPRIEEGKEYQVILILDEAPPASFRGSHLGGKIAYKMDLTDSGDMVLAGWRNSSPDTITANGRRYIWTYVAGDQYNDSEPIANNGTTPEGGIQYFSFTAQDTNWHNFDDPLYHTAPYQNFAVRGRFEVIGNEWVSEGEVELGDEDGTAGKGALTEEDMERVRALPSGSIIRITVSVTPDDGDATPGYGVCDVGGWNEDGSDNDIVRIKIPDSAPVGQPLIFTEDVDIAAVLELIPAGYQIAINPYSGATVTKAELFRPGP